MSLHQCRNCGAQTGPTADPRRPRLLLTTFLLEYRVEIGTLRHESASGYSFRSRDPSGDRVSMELGAMPEGYCVSCTRVALDLLQAAGFRIGDAGTTEPW